MLECGSVAILYCLSILNVLRVGCDFSHFFRFVVFTFFVWAELAHRPPPCLQEEKVNVIVFHMGQMVIFNHRLQTCFKLFFFFVFHLCVYFHVLMILLIDTSTYHETAKAKPTVVKYEDQCLASEVKQLWQFSFFWAFLLFSDRTVSVYKRCGGIEKWLGVKPGSPWAPRKLLRLFPTCVVPLCKIHY